MRLCRFVDMFDEEEGVLVDVSYTVDVDKDSPADFIIIRGLRVFPIMTGIVGAALEDIPSDVSSAYLMRTAQYLAAAYTEDGMDNISLPQEDIKSDNQENDAK